MLIDICDDTLRDRILLLLRRMHNATDIPAEKRPLLQAYIAIDALSPEAFAALTRPITP